MTTRFIGKNIRKKIVRPMKNSVKYKNYTKAIASQNELENKKVSEENSVEVAKKDNKKQKKGKEMVSESKLSHMEQIAGTDIPSANVKVEKAERGLYERTEESTVLLTEDNKMVLTD